MFNSITTKSKGSSALESIGIPNLTSTIRGRRENLRPVFVPASGVDPALVAILPAELTDGIRCFPVIEEALLVTTDGEDVGSGGGETDAINEARVFYACVCT